MKTKNLEHLLDSISENSEFGVIYIYMRRRNRLKIYLSYSNTLIISFATRYSVLVKYFEVGVDHSDKPEELKYITPPPNSMTTTENK